MFKIRSLITAMTCLAAVIPAQAQLLNKNLVVNGDGEAGPAAYTPADPQNIPPGWTVTGGFSVATYGGSYFLSPFDYGPIGRGAHFFYGGGANQRATATQIIDLSAAASDIDTGRVKFNLSGYLGFVSNGPESIETISIKTAFLDASGAVLLNAAASGPQVADVGNRNSGLFLRTATGYLLPNTRQVRITVDLAIESTYYFAADNISLVLAVDSLFGLNQVVNGDVEALFPGANATDAMPVPGWNANSTCTARKYGGTSLPQLTDPIPPLPGQNLLLCPSPNAVASAYQTVDITTVKTAVDGSRVSYQFSGWLGGPGDAPDNAALSLVFYDGSTPPRDLGSVNLGPVTQQDLGSRIGLQERSTSGLVPVGTRSLKVTLTFRRLRTDALSGMGLADNVSLVLNATAINSVVNAASSLPGPVAPGEFVSIYGAGLGPATGLMSTRGLEKGLGGTKVTFNGIEAYLTFSSATQINAVVPYGVSGSVSVLLQYGGQQTDPFPLTLAEASPGIFTQAYGGGQAWVVNQDQLFNSPTNTAARGSSVAFWATGQGPVTPAGVDGEVINGYKDVLLPVTATIGGLDAPVVFKGLLYPGEIQVNVKVPANSPGGNLELRLTVGTVTSRTGVMISVTGPTGPAPVLGSITTSPNPPVSGQTFLFNAAGTNFDPSTAIASFTGSACAAPCSASGLWGSATQVSGVTALQSGVYSLSVRNGASGAPSNTAILTVQAPAPTISVFTTSPTSTPSGPAFTFTIDGTSFDPSTTVVSFSGAGCSTPCTATGVTGTTTHLSGSVVLSSGAYQVSVQNGVAGSPSNVVPFTVTVPVPSLSGITTSPVAAIDGSAFTFTLSGGNLDPANSIVSFNGPGCVSSCTLTGLAGSSTALTGSVTLPAGVYTVKVRTGASGTPSNAQTFTVYAPSIVAIATSPNPPAGGASFTFSIGGAYFDPAIAVVSFSGPGCAPCTVSALSGPSSSVQLVGSTTLATGDYTVTVRNGPTGTPSISRSLTVSAAVPSIAGLATSPNPPVTAQVFSFTITGANFNPSAAIAYFSGGACGNPCSVGGLSGSSTQLTGSVTLTAGAYTVTVRNGASGTPSNGIALIVPSGSSSSTPILGGIATSPDPPVAALPFTFTLTGTNFSPSTAIAFFSGPGCGIPCSATALTGSATQLSGSTFLSAGTFTVTVRNGVSGTASNGMTLTVSIGSSGATPILSGITTAPSPPVAQQPFTFSIAGASFDPSAAIAYFSGPGCSTPCSVSSLTGTQTRLSGVLALSTGIYSVTVRNGASGIASNAVSLTVSSGASATPTLSTILPSPNPPLNGQPFTFTLTGLNFDPSTAIAYFSGPGCSTPCSVSGLNSSSTQLAGMNILSTGVYTVTVRNGAGGTPSNGLSLTVSGSAATPNLTAITTAPDPVSAGYPFSFTITGSNFDPAAATAIIVGPGCAPCTVWGLAGSAIQLDGSTVLNTAGNYTVKIQNGSGPVSNALQLILN